jgi:hypothetical protein
VEAQGTVSRCPDAVPRMNRPSFRANPLSAGGGDDRYFLRNSAANRKRRTRRLCLTPTLELRDSHFVPRSLYKLFHERGLPVTAPDGEHAHSTRAY